MSRPRAAVSSPPPPPGPPPPPPTDRYGFFAGPDARERDVLHGVQGPSPPPTRWAARLEALRADKWRHYLGGGAATWPTGRALVTRVRKGVPDALRGVVWRRLAGTAALAARQPGLYAAALAREPSPADLLMIAVDLPRTYPQHALFAMADVAAPTRSSSTAAMLADSALSPGQVRCARRGHCGALLRRRRRRRSRLPCRAALCAPCCNRQVAPSTHISCPPPPLFCAALAAQRAVGLLCRRPRGRLCVVAARSRAAAAARPHATSIRHPPVLPPPPLSPPQTARAWPLWPACCCSTCLRRSLSSCCRR